MTTPLDLTDEERAQLRVLYSVHLNPGLAATYRHDVCRSLVAKHLAECGDRDPVFASITARGIEIAKTL